LRIQTPPLGGLANADGSISSVSKAETGISRLAKRIPELLGICEPSLGTESREKILFEAVYPWAGQDRRVTAPDLAVSKGSVLFARPEDIQLAVDFALDHGQDKKFVTTQVVLDSSRKAQGFGEV
jgi:hypothetical protein